MSADPLELLKSLDVELDRFALFPEAVKGWTYEDPNTRAYALLRDCRAVLAASRLRGPQESDADLPSAADVLGILKETDPRGDRDPRFALIADFMLALSDDRQSIDLQSALTAIDRFVAEWPR